MSLLILGIESSCDETGVALVRSTGADVPTLLAHALHSQIDMHQAYGGVVPELASRDHIRRVLPLTQAVMAESGPHPGRGGCGGLHARPQPGRGAAGEGRAWPVRWVRRWANRCWAYTTWKGICSRPF